MVRNPFVFWLGKRRADIGQLSVRLKNTGIQQSH